MSTDSHYKVYAFSVLRFQPFRKILLGLIFLLSCNPAMAESVDIEQTANTLFKSFTRTDSVETDLKVTPDLAIAVQEYYIALLRPTWGMDVGYIAQATDEMSVAKGAPTGILLENMFTGTRAVIDRTLGIDMQAAAELYFRVKSENLNTATTREEALVALDSVIPGVRLSDALLPIPVGQDQSLHSAANLEVRMCVLGGPLQLSGEQNWNERLANFSVMMSDQDKQQIATLNPSMSVHPLDAVLATRDALLQRGIQVVAGDILAVGTLTDAHRIENLTRLRAEFKGLSDEQQVYVYMGFR